MAGRFDDNTLNIGDDSNDDESADWSNDYLQHSNDPHDRLAENDKPPHGRRDG